MKAAIHEAAYEALGQKQASKSRKEIPWRNEKLEPLITSKKRAYERWIQMQTP